MIFRYVLVHKSYTKPPKKNVEYDNKQNYSLDKNSRKWIQIPYLSCSYTCIELLKNT
jgi:hypothetical protein